MDFQAYNKILICPDDIRNIQAGNEVTGYTFRIKYPSYRGAFLSCIEELKFWVDDEALSSEDVAFCLNGKEFLLEELPECYKEYWYVRDAATIRVFRLGGLAAGEHKIRVYMKHRVPYTGYFGQYLVLESDVTETRKLAEADTPAKDSVCDPAEPAVKEASLFADEVARNTGDIKLGITLYSFATEFIHEKLDIEQILKKTHDMGYKGVEIVAAMMVPNYPYPEDSWLEWFKERLAYYELEPVCWSAYIDMGIRSDRDLTENEIIRFTLNDMIYAKKAGFPLVRTQHAISPAIYRKMIPYCKDLGVKLAIEMHHPHHPDVPVWKEYLELMKGEGKGWLGVVPDFSIFQTLPHKLYLDQAKQFGCREAQLDQIVAIHKSVQDQIAAEKANGSARADEIREEALKGLEGQGYNEIELHTAEEMFSKFSAPAKLEQWKDLIEVVPYIHGKFYYLENGQHDPCIPFEDLLTEIKRLGYKGYISSEYEGHHFDETVDSEVQLSRYVELCTRILTD